MDAVVAGLQAALAGRYVLERELGRGGMATVYLAQDLKHDRPVALKVLHPELAAALGPERFLREIRLTASLQHPHILPVHDSGEAAGRLWYTMPYVEGESLRDRLRRERQLPVEDALRITREAAQALQYAHEHGVVHRDIKPENLLLTKDGNTLVADFGIARALAGDEQLTQTGMSVGTPTYMSPEQASGDKALDARTDVYSLGCVLYEMLAGEPPFTGPTVQAITAKKMSGSVPGVRQVRPSVPLALDHALQRALAPVPADRFGIVTEFARALEPLQAPETVVSRVVLRRRPALRLAAIGAAFLLGVGLLFAWRRLHVGASEGAGPKVLAVLPFQNLGDSSDAYFADGVTEEVRGRLSRVAGLEVIAGTSCDEYRHTTKRAREIARELGVDYLLTATVRWEKRAAGASRVRVMPELVDVRPGQAPRTRWAEPFDASLTDVFQVQSDIARKVASALDVALGDSAHRALTVAPTGNLAAYDAFLRGEAAAQALAMRDPPSLRRAIAFYEQAVALDSAFAGAWGQLARARAHLYLNGTPTPALAAAARQAAERAQGLGPNRPDSRLAMGDYYAYVVIDNARALAAYEAGLKLAPSSAELLVATGLAEQSLGRWDASLRHLLQAVRLDPRSPATARRTGMTLLRLHRYAEAEAMLNRALALAPTNLTIIEDRATAALAQGDLPAARAILRAALARVEPTALIATVGGYGDWPGDRLCWVLDDAQQQELLTLPPSAFDDDRGVWAMVRAQTYQLRGRLALARAYADTAQLAFTVQLRSTPDDAERRAARGVALAYLGRKAEAIAEGRRALALWPMSRDAYLAPYIQHELARIYVIVGEPEKALDQLEPLLEMPYILSPGWLRIDPTFAPLKGNPRFERLVAGK